MDKIDFIINVKKFEQEHKNLFEKLSEYYEEITTDSSIFETQESENGEYINSVVKLDLNKSSGSVNKLIDFLNKFTETERRYLVYVIISKMIDEMDKEYILDAFYNHLSEILKKLDLGDVYHEDIIEISQNIKVDNESLLLFLFTLLTVYNLIAFFDVNFQYGRE